MTHPEILGMLASERRRQLEADAARQRLARHARLARRGRRGQPRIAIAILLHAARSDDAPGDPRERVA